MGKTSLLHGILAACLLSAFSTPLWLGLQWLGGVGLTGLIAALGLGYIAYLLAASPSRRGRVILGVGSVIILLGTCIVNPTAGVASLLAVGMIWLVRSVLYHSGLFLALWDGALCAVSIICALGTALSTHSLWLTVWVFFLLQALFVCLPQQFATPRHGRSGRSPLGQDDAFARAHRAAEDALQAMAQRA